MSKPHGKEARTPSQSWRASREMGIAQLHTARDFSEATDSDFTAMLAEATDTAVLTGFDAALRLVTGNPIRVGDEVVGAVDADLLKLFRGLNIRQRHELVKIALDMEAEK
jgi:hypothetical protein